MEIIRSRAPLRLGLSGGGTDVSPFCDVHGGYVLNATIDRYAYAAIQPNADLLVTLESLDQGVSRSFSLDEEICCDGALRLHAAVYIRMIRDYNNGSAIPLRVSTFCDAPLGSGLGSSSTIVVAMVRAFVELLNLPLGDYEIAKLAYVIERLDCNISGGKQDQYSAAFGGFNFMEFYADDKVVVNPLRIRAWIRNELESSLLLYFSGLSRASSQIIESQRTAMSRRDASALDAMKTMKLEAVSMKECLLRGDFPGLVSSLASGWESKKRSSAAVSNPLIESIYESAMSSGALGGKVSGAGGGGFIMFFVPLAKRMSVISALNRFDGLVSNCHFSDHGCDAWRC